MKILREPKTTSNLSHHPLEIEYLIFLSKEKRLIPDRIDSPFPPGSLEVCLFFRLGRDGCAWQPREIRLRVSSYVIINSWGRGGRASFKKAIHIFRFELDLGTLAMRSCPSLSCLNSMALITLCSPTTKMPYIWIFSRLRNPSYEKLSVTFLS